MTKQKPESEALGPNGVLFKTILLRAVALGSSFGLDPMAVVAVLGQVVGDVIGVNDLLIEKEKGIKEGDVDYAPFKQTFDLNYNVSYNEMRGLLEEKQKKPEPKIV